MPRGKTTGKASGKPACQLLFSEALRQQKHSPVADPLTPPHTNMTEDTQGASMDRILQEISAVGRKLEVTTVEAQAASWTNRDQELLHLRSRLTDLEDRSRRNNIRLLGIPEGTEGADIPFYLRDMLPKLTDTTFDPPLEFQRAHRHGPKRQDGKGRPPPIIACMLRHGQARQLLQTARTQGPLRLGTLEIRLSADFSRETAERRRAFLSLRPRLRHLNVKFGLFEPARMWITKNGESQTFYDPEDLRMFLEGLHDTSQTMETTVQSSPHSQDAQGQALGAGQPETVLDPDRRTATDSQTRGRDLERLTKNYDDRGQILQAVAMYTQLSDRDKSRSPLKPTVPST
ncbi:hypothetical protein NDU88_003212 [Pleurodeles waltl]|uniref:L1 transposable element RRM domain-containing protein n=1 Tax=Pleurodeles waltl TaxID=8319 RepID=A0AAV7M3W5_PLEWA|nr:hypothetical protein NDU88_003212 [Pleurodeles waltl]